MPATSGREREKVARATITSESGGVLEFLYNPHELEEAKFVVWEQPETEGGEGPPTKFKRGGPKTFRLTAKFINTGNPDEIEAQLDTIRGYAKPTGPSSTPPRLMLGVGKIAEPVYLLEYRIIWNQFTPGLRPKEVQVEMNLTRIYEGGEVGPEVSKSEKEKKDGKDGEAGAGREEDWLEAARRYGEKPYQGGEQKATKGGGD